MKKGLISVDSVKKALATCRGDLFTTAAYLNVYPRELDSYIRLSGELQAFVGTIDRVKADQDYDRISAEQFAERLEVLTRAYKAEAIDIIHELATMPFDTAAMAEIKLKAAVQLRGAAEVKQANNDHMAVLAELNQLYQQSAPRIKSIRVAQVEYES